jgi:uncharacterized membrane protein
LVERLFELLFKYRPVVFEQGELAFGPPWPALVAVIAVIAAGVVVVWTYRRVRVPASVWRRALLLGLRIATLALILFCLLAPVLIVRTVASQRNFLAVLVDDSRSMAIADGDGAPRSAFVREAFSRDAKLRSALAARFSLRFFRFSSSADRLADLQALTFAGTRSNIGQALTRVSEELAGLPVSGIVLVSDGADTSQAAIADALRSMKSSGLPVFTVGVGRERFARDVQMGRVEPPASVLKGATVVVETVIAQTGYAGRTVSLVVEDEGHIVGSQDVTLPPDGEPATVRVRFTLAEAGARLLRFRLPTLEGEQVAQNNVREALVNVKDRREKLLYIEGEPRFEMKFLRQAVSGDKNLQVVTLQRTAERKFLRLDVDSADEVAGGFPKTRDELFTYRGLILGSVEASTFTPDQLRMIADFVSMRGGGLLALGGRHSFAEGGYAGTPVAEALPVVLPSTKAPGTFLEYVKVRPTPLGETHIATEIADTEQASTERWKKLPPLTAVNPIREAKPGASVLLTGPPGRNGESQIVLAFQRYGAGSALALGVQDSWLWRMSAEIAVEDTTHQTLWRRLLRWLVDGVPERVSARADRERVEPGDAVAVSATVRDAGFVEVNDATVRARVIGPSGHERDMPMDFVVDKNGEYRGSFVADEKGLYEVRVDATRGRDSVGQDVTYVRSAPGDDEYFDAAMQGPLLRRIASETGGRFYTPASVSSLPDDITYLGRGVTVVEQKQIWDMPIVLLALVSLAGGEWFLRRRWGLA